jgi:hypothetical protein
LLVPAERSVKVRLVSDCGLAQNCEGRVPQFRHRRVATAEFARLELPLLDLSASSVSESVTAALSVSRVSAPIPIREYKYDEGKAEPI